MKKKKESEFILKEEESSNNTSTSIPKLEEDEKNLPPEFKLYRIRWPIWIFFTLSMAASGLAQIGLGPIMTIIQDIYGVKGIMTSLLILPFTIFFIPLIFPANYLIENYGITIPVYIASITLVVGAWIRMFVNTSFYFLLAGQWVMALGQPFVLSSPAKLAGVWFGDKERAIATTVGSIAAPFGAVIGYLLPLALISDDDVTPQSHGESRFLKYILVQSIIITALGLPILLFIRNQPPTPPSASAANSMRKKSGGMIKSMKKLMTSIDFIWLTLAFSSIYTIYTTLGASLAPLTNSFGYNSQDNSLFGSIYVAGGVFGSFVHAIFLDRYARYKLQYVIIGILNWVSFALVIFLIDRQNTALTAVLLWFMGFAQLPIIGVSYSFWAELTYPINEALSWGLVQLFGSIIATAFTFLATSFITAGKKFIALYILLGLWCVGLLWKLLVREILKKKRAGIRGTIFSFHIGSHYFPNSYRDLLKNKRSSRKREGVQDKDSYSNEYKSDKSDRVPLIDSNDIDRIE